MEEKRIAPNVVYCDKCGMGNPAGNKFCYDCGGSLHSLACSFCSQNNPHYAKFCGSCGRKLKR
ncbi:double zinc ribbon domain-containing protein [[Eubacterium] cellulosolvens]